MCEASKWFYMKEMGASVIETGTSNVRMAENIIWLNTIVQSGRVFSISKNVKKKGENLKITDHNDNI